MLQSADLCLSLHWSPGLRGRGRAAFPEAIIWAAELLWLSQFVPWVLNSFWGLWRGAACMHPHPPAKWVSPHRTESRAGTLPTSVIKALSEPFYLHLLQGSFLSHKSIWDGKWSFLVCVYRTWSKGRVTGHNQAHQESSHYRLMMYSLGPALVRVSVLPCPDPDCHSFPYAAYSTFPFDSSEKAGKKSWFNHGKESLSLTFLEMGTHKQQIIISVKRSRTHTCWIWLKRWQDTNLIIRNEYDKSCAQTGTRTTCSPITLSTARNVSPQQPMNHSIKILICSILLVIQAPVW